MCCTIGDVTSSLSDTLIYVGEGKRDGKIVHVMAYQNTAVTFDGEPNAMILPFPTSTPMGPENMVDTKSFGSFLEDISNASKHVMKSRSLYASDSMKGGPAAASIAQVFDSGSYTVILADHVKQIPEALNRVPENKRPKVSLNFLFNYGRMYPNQPIVICCWAGRLEAEPILWWYEPTDPTNLFIPTMDAHDGKAPNVEEDVFADHIISVGSVNAKDGAEVSYTSKIADGLKGLFPKFVHGTRLNYTVKNGDMFVAVADLKTNGDVFIKRGTSVNQFHMKERMLGWH